MTRFWLDDPGSGWRKTPSDSCMGVAMALDVSFVGPPGLLGLGDLRRLVGGLFYMGVGGLLMERPFRPMNL